MCKAVFGLCAASLPLLLTACSATASAPPRPTNAPPKPAPTTAPVRMGVTAAPARAGATTLPAPLASSGAYTGPYDPTGPDRDARISRRKLKPRRSSRRRGRRPASATATGWIATAMGACARASPSTRLRCERRRSRGEDGKATPSYLSSRGGLGICAWTAMSPSTASPWCRSSG